ncbi:hypothetical protein SBRCBS47491_004572 [Sporothrix bragantina]|uniref:Carboxylic ester hydrolase n=1 Tax=Sporothrix bragantina TaxID=671064 RepID=A0ABP0BPZ0_9PEZI
MLGIWTWIVYILDVLSTFDSTMASFKQIGLAGLLLSSPTVATGFAAVCTKDYVQSILPASSAVEGLVLVPGSVTANAVANYSIQSSAQSPGRSNIDFCNVTVAYHHAGSTDTTNLWLWLPSPDAFQNRFLATGGGGYAITSGERGLGVGLVYGAAAGTTDGGFGSWNAQLTDVLLRANGTINYDLLYAFGYKALHEMTIIGKELTKSFFGAKDKVYSYYSGCSEGGREGWSQVQRYGKQFDGVAVGAPAFRQVFLQVMHLFGAVVENEQGYYPPQCELSRITQDAIDACDELDGKKDGVVSRTDLCRMHHDAISSVGETYNCTASKPFQFPPGPPGKRDTAHQVHRRQFAPPSPAASGSVTLAGAKVANSFWKGLFDSKTTKQVYISYPPSASMDDASTAYDASTDSYGPSVSGIGASFVNYFLSEHTASANSLPVPIRNLTSDQLVTWILEGLQKYSDTVQTDWPYLGDYHSNGGKILHYHGESDGSIPVGSSVMYHDTVRRTMYPGQSFNDSHTALAEWYRLFLVPGAGHCSPNPGQANGPFPQTILDSLIAWVEHGQNPERLNATVLGAGSLAGQNQTLCSFPLRPLWRANGTVMDCVYDQASIDTWLPKLDGFPLPVY